MKGMKGKNWTGASTTYRYTTQQQSKFNQRSLSNNTSQTINLASLWANQQIGVTNSNSASQSTENSCYSEVKQEQSTKNRSAPEVKQEQSNENRSAPEVKQEQSNENRSVQEVKKKQSTKNKCSSSVKLEQSTSLNMTSGQISTNTNAVCMEESGIRIQSQSKNQKRPKKKPQGEPQDQPPIPEKRRRLQKQPLDPSVSYHRQKKVEGITYSFDDYECEYDADDGYDQILKNIREGIVWIKIYQTPLCNWQMTNLLFHHKFVVIKADRYYSFEKNSETIIVQVSQHQELVTHFRQNKERVKGKLVQWQPQLVKWEKLNSFYAFNKWYLRVYSKIERKDPYNLLKSNCKTYASKIYNILAEDKFWHYIQFD